MLPFFQMDLDGLARLGVQLVGIVAPIVAVVTYRRNVKTRRAEWLSGLHAKFYEAETYKGIRSVLDNEPPEFARLRDAVSAGRADELTEKFVDYLNFFEFIASLWKLGQLSLDEITMLFEYYLLNLTKNKFVQNFIDTQGFEHLAELLIAITKRRRRNG